jgi:hypothetical protein
MFDTLNLLVLLLAPVPAWCGDIFCVRVDTQIQRRAFLDQRHYSPFIVRNRVVLSLLIVVSV